MKDKTFKKVEIGIEFAFTELAKHLPMGIALQLDKLRRLIIKNANEAHQQALKEEREKIKNMDKELDIVHECLTELYEYDNIYPIIKKCLNRIEKEIAKST